MTHSPLFRVSKGLYPQNVERLTSKGTIRSVVSPFRDGGTPGASRVLLDLEARRLNRDTRRRHA
jgi:hypothetical protein